MTKKILIIGDLIIDETWYVNAAKLSPEAPVPTVFLTSPMAHISAGGASLAASYAKKNNFDSMLLTAASTDNFVWLSSKGIEVYNIQDTNNVVKIRYIDTNSNYHLLRVDNDRVVKFPTVILDRLSKQLKKLLSKDIGCIAILDYNKGIFDSTFTCQMILQLAAEKNIPVYVDTRANPMKFQGCNFLKLNQKEYDVVCTSLNIKSPYALCEVLNVQVLLVTKGKEGASMYIPTTKTQKDYNANRKQYTGTPDVTGCGDVFDINFCYHCFIEGLTPIESLELSVNQATKFAFTSIGGRLC